MTGSMTAQLARRAETWIDRLARLATPERARRYAFLMLLLTLGGGVVNLALGEGLLDRYGNVIGGDFLAFYTGARFWLDGRLPELYSLAAQAQFERELLAPQALSGPNYFINPPYALPLFAPFGWGSYTSGLALWWLAGALALAGAVEVARRELPGLGDRPRAQLWIASVCFFPTVVWLLFGQNASWSLLVYAGCFVLLRRGHDARAGACLALLAFKPQLALGPVLVLLAAGRWRALAAGAAGLAAWLGLGAWLAPEATRAYAELGPQLLEFLRGEGYDTWGIHSLFGWTTLLLGEISPRLADAGWVALSLGVAGAVVALWRRIGWTPGSPAWDLGFAAALAWGLLLSPHLFTYDLMLLLLPFGIAWSAMARSASVEGAPGRGRPGLPLDGGALLAASGVVWLAAFLSGYLTLAQLSATRAVGLPPMALQLSTLAVLAWGAAAAAHARSASHAAALDPGQSAR
jgi:hypothetical protein